jgi:GNAT superfamily N-acetyltransferase
MNGGAKTRPQETTAGNPIVVRKCGALEEFHACVGLQREVWGEADLEIEPTTMFVVASLTGGQVLGAFDGEKMVGYTLAVVGLRQGVVYLHSHQTAVSSAYRNRGVGRTLKLFQRDDALGRGIRLVEWTFDPLMLKNAHFNLNRLGAICRRYIPNLYGVRRIDWWRNGGWTRHAWSPRYKIWLRARPMPQRRLRCLRSSSSGSGMMRSRCRQCRRVCARNSPNGSHGSTQPLESVQGRRGKRIY